MKKLNSHPKRENKGLYKPYAVIKPYTISLTINDEHKTHITLQSKINDFRFAKNKEDALKQLEAENHYSSKSTSYINYIIKYLNDELDKVTAEDVDLQFTEMEEVKEINKKDLVKLEEKMIGRDC